jgi:hypothetical protein
MTVNIGGISLFVGPNGGGFGSECRMLFAFHALLEADNWKLYHYDGLSGDQRYAARLRERVDRHLQIELRRRARLMNKECGRRHVHWSNYKGQYYDEGE